MAMLQILEQILEPNLQPLQADSVVISLDLEYSTSPIAIDQIGIATRATRVGKRPNHRR